MVSDIIPTGIVHSNLNFNFNFNYTVYLQPVSIHIDSNMYITSISVVHLCVMDMKL